MSVKAVTETDRVKVKEVERIDAVCPQCGDPQTLYAHRIVAVSCEVPEVQPE
jgi:ribosomal protein S27E